MVQRLLLAAALVAVTSASGFPPGCHPPIVDPAWTSTWLLSYHPVTPFVPSQGDISGGLLINGTWNLFTSCTGGWCHLSTPDLVHYQSHGIIQARSSPGYPKSLGLGTGSVLPSPDGDGILGWVNNINGHMISRDGMRTWTALPTTTKDSPGGRDQARPLQSSDGTWFQMMGCGTAAEGEVCRFKSTDPKKLSSWTYDGSLFSKNSTYLGMPM